MSGESNSTREVLLRRLRQSEVLVNLAQEIYTASSVEEALKLAVKHLAKVFPAYVSVNLVEEAGRLLVIKEHNVESKLLDYAEKLLGKRFSNWKIPLYEDTVIARTMHKGHPTVSNLAFKPDEPVVKTDIKGMLEAMVESSSPLRAVAGPIAERVGSLSLLGIPFSKSSGEIFGSVTLVSRTPFDSGDFNLAKGTAAVIGRAIEQHYLSTTLRDSEERYRSLQENLPIGVFRTTPDGNLLSANPAMLKMLGYSSLKEFKPVPIEDVYVDVRERDEFVKRLEKDGALTDFEVRLRRKDGSSFPASISAKAVTGAGGEACYYDGILEDITVRKRDEILREVKNQLLDKLRAAGTIEDALRLGCEAVRDAGFYRRAIFTTKNETGETTHFAQVGVDEEQVERLSKAPPASREIFKQMFKKKFRISRSYFVPREAGLDFMKTGRYILQEVESGEGPGAWLQGDELFVPMLGMDGSIESWLSVDTPFDGKRPDRSTVLYLEDLADIVARQIRDIESMEALRASEERFRRFTSVVTDIIYRYDTERQDYDFISPSCEVMTGYSTEEFKADPANFWQTLIHPHDVQRVAKDRNKQLTNRSPDNSFSLDYRIIRKDGKVVCVNEHGNFEIDERGRIQSFNGVVRDITKRKQMERALVESEEMQRALFEGAADPILITDLDDITLAVNPALERVFGYKPEEIIGKPFPGHEKLDEGRFAEWLELCRRGKGISDYETTRRKKNGELIPVSVTISPVRNEEGELVSLSFWYRDVSQRKRTEEALRESEERYRVFTEEAMVGIYIYSNSKRKYLFVNPEMARITGYSREELMQIDPNQLPIPEDVIILKQREETVLKGESVDPEYTIRIRRKDSSEAVLSVRTHRISFEGEDVALGNCIDITVRRRAEEERDKHRREMQALFEGVDVLLWSVREKEDGELYYERVNSAFAVVEGYTPEHYNGMPISKLHPPDECKRIRNSFEWVKLGEPHANDVYFNKRHFIIRFIPLLDPDGRVRRFIGAGLDITERKRAEEALRDSEERYRILTEGARVGVYIFGEEGGFTYVNPAMEEITGYSREELLELNPWKLVLEEDMEGVLKFRGQAQAEGKKVPSFYTMRIKRKNGEVAVLEVKAAPLEYEGKKVQLGHCIDVTDRALAEAKIHHLNSVLRAIRNVNQLITKEFDPEKLIQGVSSRLVETHGYYSSWVALRGWEDKTVLLGEAGLEARAGFLGRLMEGDLPRCALDAMARSGVQVFDDPSSACTDCVMQEECSNHGVLSTRLESGGRIYGVLVASLPQEHTRDVEEQGLFKEVADDIALALYSIEQERERRKAEEEIKRRNEELVALYETSVVVTSTLDEDKITNLIAQRASDVINADGYVIYRYDEGIKKLVPQSTTLAKYRERILSFEVPLGAGVAGQCALQRRPILANDAHLAPKAKHVPGTPHDPTCIIAAPLVSRSELLGVISLMRLSEEGFDEHDFGLFSLFAGQAADAAANSRLFNRLRESEERYRAFTEEAMVGVYIYSDDKFLFVNRAMEEITGYSRKKLLSQSPSLITFPEDIPVLDARREARERGEKVPAQYIMRIIRRDGKVRTLEVRTRPIVFSGVTAYLGNCVDVTEIREVQDALRDSEERYRILTEEALVGVYIASRGRLMFVNPAMELITGYTREELLELPLGKLIPSEESEAIRMREQARKRGENAPMQYVMKLIRKDGSDAILELRTRPILYKNQIATLGNCIDITAMRKAQDALRESEERYRILTEEAMVGIYLVVEGKFRFVNPAMERITGYSRQELLAIKDIYEIIHPDDIKMLEERAARRRPGEPDQYTMRVIRNDGEVAVIEVRVRPIPFGNRTASLGNCVDITEMRKMQEALERSEERYRVLTEEAMMGIYISQGSRFMFVNPAMERITGYSRNELLKIDTDQIVLSEDLDFINERKKTRQPNEPDYYPMRIVRKNGEVAFLEVRTRPLSHERGEVVYLGNCVDVTEIIRQRGQIEHAKREWERTFDSISELVMIFNTEGWVVRANRAVAEYAGLDIREMLGRRYSEIFHLEESAADREFSLEICPKTPEQFEINDPKTRKVFSVTVAPIVSKTGEIVGSVHVAHDITDMRRMEQALAQSEAQFRGLAESAQDIIFNLDSKGEVRYINPALKEITGFDPAGLIGENLKELIGEGAGDLEGVGRLIENLDAMDVSERIPLFETEIQDIHGHRHVLEISSRRLDDGIVGVARDVTERKRMQQQLIQASKLASIGVLAAGIAHQVNNPLAIMLASSSLLRSLLGKSKDLPAQIEEEINSYLDTMEEQVERTTRVVSGLLEFTKPKRFEVRPADVNAVVSESLEWLSQHLSLGRLSVKMDLENGIPQGLVDSVALQQVMVNVIQNAYEAMEGGGELTITTQLSDDDKIRILVKDTGTGIPPDMREEIFEPLFTTKSASKGTGLGLAICVMLLERFEGRIYAQGDSDEGATFIIEVPVAKEEATES